MNPFIGEFEQFLAERLSLRAEERYGISDWSGTGNTIGALALRLGMLDLDQIDKILDRQEDDRRLFGELAVELGMLTYEEVDRLVALQQFHQLVEVGEHLVMRGRLTIEQLQELLSEFYSQQSQTSAAQKT